MNYMYSVFVYIFMYYIFIFSTFKLEHNITYSYYVPDLRKEWFLIEKMYILIINEKFFIVLS